MKIVISSEARLLDILGGAARFRAREAGFSEEEATSIAQGVREAASQALGHCARPGGHLTLELLTYPDRVEFLLEDRGAKVHAGGLDTSLLRRVMDAASYDAGFHDGNRLRMVKYRPGKSATRG